VSEAPESAPLESELGESTASESVVLVSPLAESVGLPASSLAGRSGESTRSSDPTSAAGAS
jgi:hypothetical protein